MKTDFDVVIAGGGPAGTSAALTFATYSSLRVAVLERSDYTATRVGETISPGVQPLLGYLGVWDHLTEGTHLRAYGTSAIWGSPEPLSRDFLFTGRGTGWHLDRAAFDRMLAEAAKAKGVSLLTEATADNVSDEGNSWRVKVKRAQKADRFLRARFVIDATGKHMAIARKLGAGCQTYDRLLGVVGFMSSREGKKEPHFTLVESTQEGWWYSVPLGDGRIVGAFMSDSDIVRKLKAHTPEGWQRLLVAAPQTHQRLRGRQFCGSLRLHSAHSQIACPASGEKWIAAGDAAASFDPLSSMGIGHAVASGIAAARAAYLQLKDDSRLMEEYSTSLESNFDRYLELRRGYYQMERRWMSQEFWKRRHRRGSPLRKTTSLL